VHFFLLLFAMAPQKAQVYNEQEMEKIKRSLNFMSEEIT